MDVVATEHDRLETLKTVLRVTSGNFPEMFDLCPALKWLVSDVSFERMLAVELWLSFI